ncbi:protein kinase [Rhizocola hellebori]|uniref:Protein kinase n=1 Tax=Rhizocola hellebori TaxID=1392758 RepID=A0A8J3QI05_9ACTN|nr:ATPase, T2SS/T4P/T4SS family [Rhizocola hellebori]GIH10055.1 protein kinase [Rhizocola hellebori]
MTITTRLASEPQLVAEVRIQVATALAGHAHDGRLTVTERRELAERYIGQALDLLARQSLAAGQPPLSAATEARIARAVADHLTGAGGLQQLLDDPTVENIDANSCDQVFVRYTNGRVEHAEPIADSDEAMIELIRTLASDAAFGDDTAGLGEERAFDRHNQQLDLRLRGGARLCAVMSVSRRPGLSIRKPTLLRAELEDLTSRGTLDEALCQVLQAAIRARLNLIIAGGTNTGKTTFARAAARAIPPKERLITIEDAYELELFDPASHPNVMSFQARRPNLEGVGAVPMAALVRTALRMNPDRVIVGETRGDEVIDLLKAMSQGNDGSFATVHASSSQQAFSRLMMYAVQAPERLTFEASAMLIAESVNLVVHLAWADSTHRVVSSVREVTGFDGRDVVSNEVWRPGPGKRAAPATPLRAGTLDRLEAAGLPPHTIDRIGW